MVVALQGLLAWRTDDDGTKQKSVYFENDSNEFLCELLKPHGQVSRKAPDWQYFLAN